MAIGDVLPPRQRSPTTTLSVASYRQTTLDASQQVEENLAALRILEQCRHFGRVKSATISVSRGSSLTSFSISSDCVKIQSEPFD
jgi:N-acyl-D-aspartate/D-glutamate deacylase